MKKLFFALIIVIGLIYPSLGYGQDVTKTTRIEFTNQGSPPSNPSSGKTNLYVDSSGNVHSLKSDGTNSTLAATSGVVTSITGTSNQVNASGSTGAVTLSLPQNIHSAATPTFAGVTITGLSGVGKYSAGVLSASSIVNADIDNAAAIANSKLANSTISGIALGANLNALDLGTGLGFSSGTTYDGSTARTLSVTSNSTIQKIEVVKNSGATVGTRKQINFIEGSNVTLTVSDDAGNDQVDVTIAASGGGGGTIDGSGTAGTIPIWSDTDTLGNSLITYASNLFTSTKPLYINDTTVGVRVGGSQIKNGSVSGISGAGFGIDGFTSSNVAVVSDGTNTELNGGGSIFFGVGGTYYASMNTTLFTFNIPIYTSNTTTGIRGGSGQIKSGSVSGISGAGFGIDGFGSTNVAVISDGTNTELNASGSLFFGVGGTYYASMNTSAFTFNVPIGINVTATSLVHARQAADSTNTSTPVGLAIDSAGASGELTASSGTQVFARIAPVVNQSGTASYRGFVVNATHTANGSGTKYLYEGQVGGTNVFAVNSVGSILIGGDTSSFPSLKRSSTELQVRLADDSADAPFKSGNLTSTGEFYGQNSHSIGLTRTIPTTVDDQVAIGDFTLTQGAAAFDIRVVVPSSSFSITKVYNVAVAFNGTSNTWKILTPDKDTGAFLSQNFDVDININNAVTSFRIRRSAGSTAGTAYVTIVQRGVNTDTFTPSTSTSSVTAPGSSYP